jgi:hypothetical protein
MLRPGRGAIPLRRSKSGESNWCPAKFVICTRQSKRSNRRAVSTAAMGLMRTVTTLGPFLEAWIALQT